MWGENPQSLVKEGERESIVHEHTSHSANLKAPEQYATWRFDIGITPIIPINACYCSELRTIVTIYRECDIRPSKIIYDLVLSEQPIEFFSSND